MCIPGQSPTRASLTGTPTPAPRRENRQAVMNGMDIFVQLLPSSFKLFPSLPGIVPVTYSESWSASLVRGSIMYRVIAAVGYPIYSLLPSVISLRVASDQTNVSSFTSPLDFMSNTFYKPNSSGDCQRQILHRCSPFQEPD